MKVVDRDDHEHSLSEAVVAKSLEVSEDDRIRQASRDFQSSHWHAQLADSKLDR